jgi:DNA polymerase I-like protein with 3'-5' exonuclease and polymerase domains
MTAPSEEWAVDAEWGYRNGRIDEESMWEPVTFCAVGLWSGRRLSFWKRDGRLRDFFHDHCDDLFIAHNAIAEMKYLLRLGVPVPPRWFDTQFGWQWFKNRPDYPHQGLTDCLHKIGAPHLAPLVKDQLRKDILHLRLDLNSPDEQRRVNGYCLSDCDGAAVLHGYLKRKVPPTWVETFGYYLAAVAKMELRGIVIDLATHNRLQNEAAALLAAFREEVNRTWPVYEGGTFKNKQFVAWLDRHRIEWPVSISPRTKKPFLSFDDDHMKEMEVRHPFIGRLRQVKKTHRHLGKRSMIVDPLTGRHYFDTNVLGSVTGRNQPKKGFIFGGPKWQRFLILVESPDHVLVYVDFAAQEVGIAAAYCGDPMMRAIYGTDDCHETFAIRAGGMPVGATKETRRRVRKAYKTVNLGILYGQTAYGISHRLGITQAAAEAIIDAHRWLFPQFRPWAERTVQGAFDRGYIRTPLGWQSKVPPESNERTWLNFMMQAGGADIMRLAMIYFDRQNVRILAPVHDGFLLSCRRDQLPDLKAAVDFACQRATEHCLGDFPLRWKMEVFHDRFGEDDEAAVAMWQFLQTLLARSNHAVPVA